MEPKTIFEDDSILVLDKPSGWVVNDAETTKNVRTVQSWLSKNFDYPISKKRELRSGIVHRLDKETSGILVVAKTKMGFEYLQKLFKERKVKKSYSALVHGRVEPDRGVVEVEVGRLPWNRKRFGILPGGRYSKTSYKVLGIYTKNENESSLVDFYPETGRTHQIRIHAKAIGHPVIGDEFYAGRKLARNDRKWCPRLFLHASKISFKHPNLRKGVIFESKLPGDLQKVLDSLEKVG